MINLNHHDSVSDTRAPGRAALHTELGRRLQQAMRQIIDRREKQLKHLDAILRTLGPDSSLQRGYSITFDAHGRILRSADDANVGETITTRLAHGTIESTVTTMAQQSRSSVS